MVATIRIRNDDESSHLDIKIGSFLNSIIVARRSAELVAVLQVTPLLSVHVVNDGPAVRVVVTTGHTFANRQAFPIIVTLITMGIAHSPVIPH